MAVTKTNACMACVDNVEYISEDEDGNEQLRTQWCPTPNFWWRSDQFLMTRLGMSNRINPIKFLRFLYWFGQRIPIEQIVAYTGIKAKSAAHAVRCIRLALTKKKYKNAYERRQARSREHLRQYGLYICDKTKTTPALQR